MIYLYIINYVIYVQGRGGSLISIAQRRTAVKLLHTLYYKNFIIYMP